MSDIEREREIGRGRSRLHARSPMWDLIPGSGMESCIGLLAWSLLLPLPMSLPLFMSLMNKLINLK